MQKTEVGSLVISHFPHKFPRRWWSSAFYCCFLIDKSKHSWNQGISGLKLIYSLVLCRGGEIHVVVYPDSLVGIKVQRWLGGFVHGRYWGGFLAIFERNLMLSQLCCYKITTVVHLMGAVLMCVAVLDQSWTTSYQSYLCTICMYVPFVSMSDLSVF